MKMKAAIGRLLCRMDLHKWNPVAPPRLERLSTTTDCRCQRCGLRSDIVQILTDDMVRRWEDQSSIWMVSWSDCPAIGDRSLAARLYWVKYRFRARVIGAFDVLRGRAEAEYWAD